MMFMDILISGLLVCTAEPAQGMQDKTSMEFQDLLRKVPAPCRGLGANLLPGKTSTSGNLLGGKQIQVAVV